MPSRITILDNTLDHSIGELPPSCPLHSKSDQQTAVGQRSSQKHEIFEQVNNDEDNKATRQQRVRFENSQDTSSVAEKTIAISPLRRYPTQRLNAGLTPDDRKRFFDGKDITSSKSLLGYVMNCVFSAVVATASIMSKYSPKSPLETLIDGQIVVIGRLSAVIVLSCIGFALSLFIVSCHFDSWLFPRVWADLFKKGSNKERNLLIFLLVYWTFTVGMSTGLYSLGQLQPNVFFGCWVCLASIFYAYDQWRDEADKITCIGWIFDGAYETKRSLVGIAVASGLVFLSGLDMLAIYHIHRGQAYNDWMEQFMTHKIWLWIFICPSISLLFVVGILIVREKHFTKTTNNPPIWWSILEGFIHIGLFSVWTFVAFTFTERLTPVNFVGNFYFGSWLAFLFSMSAFGSWFKNDSFHEIISQFCRSRHRKRASQNHEGVL